MKVDSALRRFTESFDREAMSAIDRISNEYGLVINNHTISGYNIRESFENFNSFLAGYKDFKIKFKDAKSNNLPTDKMILENANAKIPGMVEMKDILYKDLPQYVRSYAEGVASLLKTVDTVKGTMMEQGIDQESIGAVNLLCDQFMENVDAKFYESMKRILKASGYRTAEDSKPVVDRKTGEDPVFL